jgi:hypothetical protein
MTFTVSFIGARSLLHVTFGPHLIETWRPALLSPMGNRVIPGGSRLELFGGQAGSPRKDRPEVNQETADILARVEARILRTAEKKLWG